MKLTGKSRADLIDIFTSGSVMKEEAARMVDILKARKVEDTNDLSTAEWINCTNQAKAAP